MAKRIGLLGKKLGMTRIFADDGTVVPVTVIQAGPCPIVQRKDKEKDGYNALQVGFDAVEDHRVNRPAKGHLAKAGKGFFRRLREFRIDDPAEFAETEELTVSLFSPGDRVKVTGTSIGKGFAGVITRWGFAGLPASHGHEKVHRSPGSVGQCAFPGKIFKGKRMPGQMGNRKSTCINVEVVEVRPEENILFVRGQVPGPRSGLVTITK